MPIIHTTEYTVGGRMETRIDAARNEEHLLFFTALFFSFGALRRLSVRRLAAGFTLWLVSGPPVFSPIE